MKISVASLMLAVLAEVAVARNCKAGLDYCGTTLLAIGTIPWQTIESIERIDWQNPGDYQSEMEAACTDISPDYCEGDKAKDILYSCRSGLTNSIVEKKRCLAGCADGGSGKSDYCL
jgi:hypothetical protein